MFLLFFVVTLFYIIIMFSKLADESQNLLLIVFFLLFFIEYIFFSFIKHKQVTSFIFQGNELNKAKVSMLNSSFLLKKN